MLVPSSIPATMASPTGRAAAPSSRGISVVSSKNASGSSKRWDQTATGTVSISLENLSSTTLGAAAFLAKNAFSSSSSSTNSAGAMSSSTNNATPDSKSSGGSSNSSSSGSSSGASVSALALFATGGNRNRVKSTKRIIGKMKAKEEEEQDKENAAGPKKFPSRPALGIARGTKIRNGRPLTSLGSINAAAGIGTSRSGKACKAKSKSPLNSSKPIVVKPPSSTLTAKILPPTRPRCHFYASGSCRNGDACAFLHADSFAQKEGLLPVDVRDPDSISGQYQAPPKCQTKIFFAEDAASGANTGKKNEEENAKENEFAASVRASLGMMPSTTRSPATVDNGLSTTTSTLPTALTPSAVVTARSYSEKEAEDTTHTKVSAPTADVNTYASVCFKRGATSRSSTAIDETRDEAVVTFQSPDATRHRSGNEETGGSAAVYRKTPYVKKTDDDDDRFELSVTPSATAKASPDFASPYADGSNHSGLSSSPSVTDGILPGVVGLGERRVSSPLGAIGERIEERRALGAPPGFQQRQDDARQNEDEATIIQTAGGSIGIGDFSEFQDRNAAPSTREANGDFFPRDEVDSSSPGLTVTPEGVVVGTNAAGWELLSRLGFNGIAADLKAVIAAVSAEQQQQPMRVVAMSKENIQAEREGIVDDSNEASSESGGSVYTSLSDISSGTGSSEDQNDSGDSNISASIDQYVLNASVASFRGGPSSRANTAAAAAAPDYLAFHVGGTTFFSQQPSTTARVPPSVEVNGTTYFATAPMPPLENSTGY